jgi:hypothetical protein
MGKRGEVRERRERKKINRPYKHKRHLANFKFRRRQKEKKIFFPFPYGFSLSQNNLTRPRCYQIVNEKKKKKLLLILVQCNEEMSTDLQCTYRITFKNSINPKE